MAAARKTTIVGFILSCIVCAVFFPAVCLLLGGSFRWWEGWVFGLWCDAMVLSMVRVQTERKQRVVTTGVYGFVRHPLYLGCLLMLLGAALLLGSICGLVIGVLAVCLLVVRIVGEERMLVNELDGYRDYRKKVTYRLIPFVW